VSFLSTKEDDMKIAARLLATLVGSLLLGTGRPATAEEPSAPENPRVRVTLLSSERLVGTLLGQDDDTLILRTPQAPAGLRLTRESIANLEVSHRRGNRGKALGRGLLIGMATGGVLGYLLGEDCSAQAWLCFSRGDVAAGGAVLGASLGAILGLGFSHGEAWQPAAPGRFGLAVTPLRKGAVVRVAVRF